MRVIGCPKLKKSNTLKEGLNIDIILLAMTDSGFAMGLEGIPAKQYQAGDPCPECSHTLEIRTAIRGKKMGQNYIGCSDFPDCRFYAWPSF